MNLRAVGEEVFQTIGGVVQVGADDIAVLADKARQNTRKRARLCAHPGSDDRLHEMIIMLARETYIRPHRHADKSESFHLIEGELDVILFHDDGAIRDIVRMGEYRSARAFYYRLMEGCFHTVLINTPFAFFHETTNGPFNRADTEFAYWSPAEGAFGVAEYVNQLRKSSIEWKPTA